MTDRDNAAMNDAIRGLLRPQEPSDIDPTVVETPVVDPPPKAPPSIDAGAGAHGSRVRLRPSMNTSIRALIKGEAIE
jgi:hypothetical protein